MDRINARLKQSTWMNYAGWFLILVGTVLRLRQYFINRSLWMDEASLALNIANRTFQGLTQPLDYAQGSPLGFLFIEKLSVLALGNRDHVMRLFPLFSGILAIYLIYRIAREHLGVAGLFAVLLFAISTTLIYISSELKQYSTDIMMALLLVFLAGPCFKKGSLPRDFLILGASGVIAIGISHPAAFVLAGIGVTLFFDRMLRKDLGSLAWILGLGAAWSMAFGLEYVVSLQHLASDKFLQQYWHKAFMPMPPWSNPRWFLQTYFSLVLVTVNRADSIMAFALAALASAGAVSLLVRDRQFAFILILPFFIALFASALQKYPLKLRFLLFLVPLVLLLAAAGLRALYHLISRAGFRTSAALSVLTGCVVFGLSLSNQYYELLHPPLGSDIKPVLEYVARNRRPDDILYIYHSSEPAYKYYAPFYDLDEATAMIGFDTTRKKLALEAFQDDVSGLDGSPRIWFIFSDIVDCGDCQGDMQAYYVGYLNGFGRLLDEFNAAGANAYLYDLGP
jgi:hypothetical protein